MEPKVKKPKKKPGLKLKITEEHKAPIDCGIRVGDESKAVDSIQRISGLLVVHVVDLVSGSFESEKAYAFSILCFSFSCCLIAKSTLHSCLACITRKKKKEAKKDDKNAGFIPRGTIIFSLIF